MRLNDHFVSPKNFSMIFSLLLHQLRIKSEENEVMY